MWINLCLHKAPLLVEDGGNYTKQIHIILCWILWSREERREAGRCTRQDLVRGSGSDSKSDTRRWFLQEETHEQRPEILFYCITLVENAKKNAGLWVWLCWSSYHTRYCALFLSFANYSLGMPTLDCCEDGDSKGKLSMVSSHMPQTHNLSFSLFSLVNYHRFFFLNDNI